MTARSPAANTTLSPKPLSVVLTSSGNDLVTPGTEFTLGVTIHNLGQESAIIYAYLDERSPNMRQWCESMQERLALASQQSGEVSFTIKIPTDALPEVIEYDLVIDATDAYPTLSPIRYAQRCLQILPSDRQTVEASDPTFYLEPQTTAQNPAVIQPVGGLPIQVWIENRSDRVDRFRLSCLGLPADWLLTVNYPKDYQGLGLVRDADSLGLNPGDHGQISLMITPPAEAIADIYIPTIRLTSQNSPDLNLLELLYLQVPPTYLLQATLQTLRNQVRNQAALFEVQLINAGNTPRQLQLAVQELDEPESCFYTLDSEHVLLPPFSKQQRLLEGKPRHRRKQAWYGSGRLFNFRVQLQDLDDHPLLVPTLQGNFSWLARPWWQLLLCILAVLGLLGTAAFLIWWYLLRPPAPPRILSFAVADARYAQANEDFVRVDWQIEQSEQIEQIVLTGYSADDEVISGPLVYSLSADGTEALPAGLAPFCTEQRSLLTCNNLRTDASRPGDYTFELTVISNNERHTDPITQRTNPVAIDPRPVPIITDFLSTSLRYRELGSQSASQPESPQVPVLDDRGILLNWRVANIDNLKALKLVGRTGEGDPLGERMYPLEQTEDGLQLPNSLEEFCDLDTETIVCANVPTTLTGVSTYQFELTAVPLDGPSANSSDPAADESAAPTSAMSERITVEPRPPEIVTFLVDGQPAAAKYVIPIAQNLTLPLSWSVEGGATTQVKLLPAPGPVPLEAGITLPLKPESGSVTITLQAENAAGQSIAQSIVVETYDPTPPVTPTDVAAAAAAAAGSAAAESAAAASDAAGEEANGGAVGAASGDVPDSGSLDTGGGLFPSELPPRFN